MIVEDALAHDLERGNGNGEDAALFPDDEDESYKFDEDANSNDDEKAELNKNWDDEENIKSLTEGDLADCVQSSLDAMSHEVSIKGSGKATPGSITAKSHLSRR